MLILCVKYFYNRLIFKVVINKSYRGHFFPDTVYLALAEVCVVGVQPSIYNRTEANNELSRRQHCVIERVQPVLANRPYKIFHFFDEWRI